MKPYHIVYLTVNLVNQKFYIGYHATSDYKTFDGYLGSGKTIKKAIKKYGKNNFRRDLIAVFSNSIDALKFEHDYLNLIDYTTLPNCYNICAGGRSLGTWAVENKVGRYSASSEQLSEWGKQGGAKLLAQKLGIHGLSDEERRIMNSNRVYKQSREVRSAKNSESGKVGGNKCRDNKIGFHAMTHEEMSARSKATIANADPEWLAARGRLLGASIKGSKCYNDGVNYWRYTLKQQDIISFDEFLANNPQYNRGRVRKTSTK